MIAYFTNDQSLRMIIKPTVKDVATSNDIPLE